MSLRLALVCLALFVVVFGPLCASAAPYESAFVEGNVVPELGTTAPPPTSEPAQQKQRTFFLLLPLLLPNQFYF